MLDDKLKEGKVFACFQAGGARRKKQQETRANDCGSLAVPLSPFPTIRQRSRFHEEPSSGTAPRWKLHTIRSRKLVATYSARERKTQRQEKCARPARSDRNSRGNSLVSGSTGDLSIRGTAEAKGLRVIERKYAPCKFPGFPGCNIIAP